MNLSTDTWKAGLSLLNRCKALSAHFFTECITMMLFFVVAYLFYRFKFFLFSNLDITHFKVWPPINCHSVHEVSILSWVRLYPKKKWSQQGIWKSSNARRLPLEIHANFFAYTSQCPRQHFVVNELVEKKKETSVDGLTYFIPTSISTHILDTNC